MVNNAFLTEKEAAALLKIPVRTLMRLRLAGKSNPPLPYCNLGTIIRYCPDDLMKWAKMQRFLTPRGRRRQVEEIECAVG